MTEIVDYFDRVRERTLRVAACIPPEHIEWSYKPGKYTLSVKPKTKPHAAVMDLRQVTLRPVPE